MLFHSHVKIGKLLYKWFVESFACRLPRQAFLYGNIKPDLVRRGEADRHVLKNARHWITHRVGILSELASQSESQLMRELQAGLESRHQSELSPADGPIFAAILAGEICHHVSDLFCRYHFESHLYPDFFHHFLYEIKLHHRLLRHWQGRSLQQLCNAGSDDIRNRHSTDGSKDVMVALQKGLSAYREHTPSCDVDILFALQACMETLTLLEPDLRTILARAESASISAKASTAYAVLINPDTMHPVLPDPGGWFYGEVSSEPFQTAPLFREVL